MTPAVPRRDSVFLRRHPAVQFLFFVAAIGSAMVFTHPVHILTGLLVSTAWLGVLRGRKGVFSAYLLGLPMALMVLILSPLASSRGRTVLFSVLGRAVTSQAVVYAALSAGMLLLVILWFSLYAEILTSDRFLYLFARMSPAVALVISMTLGLIPTMRRRLTLIRRAREGLYGTAAVRGRRAAVRDGMTTLTALLTWSMEGAVVTADSMRARGYGGRRRRTTYAPFRFRTEDVTLLLTLTGLFAAAVVFHLAGTARYAVYPQPDPILWQLPHLLSYLLYGGMLSLPLILELRESAIWR